MSDCWTDLELAQLVLERDDDPDDAKSPRDEARRSHERECRSCAAALVRIRAALGGLTALDRAELEPTAPPPAVWEQIRARTETPAVAVRLAPEIKIACTYCKGRLEGRARHCAVCLGPHHDDCWEEHGRCAACGAALFVRAESSGKPRTREAWRSVALLLTGALAGTAAAAVAVNLAGTSKSKIATPSPGAGSGMTWASLPSPSPMATVPPNTSASKAPSPAVPELPLAPRVGQRLATLAPSGPYRVGRKNDVVLPALVETPLAFDPELGLLFAVSRAGEVQALRDDGTKMWKTPVGDFGDPTPGVAIIPGKGIVVAGCDGRVQALDSRTGRVVWSQPLNAPVTVRPCVAPALDLVVVATANGDVVALDLGGSPGSGRVLWATETDPLVQPPLVYTQGSTSLVLAATRGEAIHALDAKTGRLVGSYFPGSRITAGPVAHGQRLFVGTEDGRVIASDSLTAAGAAFVTTPLPSPVLELVPLDDGSVAARTEGAVDFIDRLGMKRARIALPDSFAGLVLGRRLYAVSRDGAVVAFDPATAREVWQGDLEPPHDGFPVFGKPILAGDALLAVAAPEGAVFAMPTHVPD